MTLSDAELATTIDDAYVYGFPVWEIARTRQADLDATDPSIRIDPNQLRHDRRLGDHTMRWITTPNNDTLYSRAWLDLSAGPVRVEVDAMAPGRYWSVAFLDAYSNNFAMIGTRLDGVGPVAVELVGPGGRQAAAATDTALGRDDPCSPAVRVIEAPGNDVWLFARWIVDGPADLPNAHAMQQGLRVIAPPAPPPVRGTPFDGEDPQQFLAVVNARLGRNPPPMTDRDALARFAAVGLVPGDVDAWERLPARIRAIWQQRIVHGPTLIRRSLPRPASGVRGWVVRPPHIGNFGTDYPLRAAIALGGLAALEPVEAVYASLSAADDGERLHGGRRYRWRLPPQGLPLDGFWSLSMYETTPDGRLFFTDNPIDRYTIGDRTRGLHRDASGGLEIAIQAEPPDDETARANWLPAPAGSFVLVLRAYLPRSALREGTAAIPGIISV